MHDPLKPLRWLLARLGGSGGTPQPHDVTAPTTPLDLDLSAPGAGSPEIPNTDYDVHSLGISPEPDPGDAPRR